MKPLDGACEHYGQVDYKKRLCLLCWMSFLACPICKQVYCPDCRSGKLRIKREIMFMIGTQKMYETGVVSARYYQAIVGVGSPIGHDRILRRKWKTKSEAMKYLIDFYFTWSRLHNEKIEA